MSKRGGGRFSAAMQQQWQRTSAMFVGHNSSIKAMLASEVFFGTALGWFFVYRSLYMVALGATEVQVGFITALVLCTQAIGAVLGGYCADRFGRKPTMQFFDSLGWITATFLWIIAQNVWYFVAAALLNGLFFGAIPSWNCIIAEHTPSERRASVYGLVHLMFLGSGLFGPLGGLFVARYGIITGSRIIYSLGFVIILSALFIRQRWVKEPSRTQGGADASVAAPAEFSQTLRLMLANRQILCLVLSRLLTMFAFTVWSTYSGLYMTGEAGLNLPPSIISIIPALNSLSMMLVLLVVIPHITEKHYLKFLLYGGLMIILGSAVFLATPSGFFWPLALFALLNAGGGAILDPIRSGYLANVAPPEALAKVISLSSTISLLAMIPAGPIAGALYQLNVRLPFYLALSLQVVNLLLFFSLHSYVTRSAKKPAAA